MLATLDDRPFDREGWIFERKLDGERCLGFRCGETVRLLSRSGTSLAATYPELTDALLEQAVDDFVVDGEVVAFVGRRTSFARLQRRMHITDERAARRSPVRVHYYLFDLLHVTGHDITSLPLFQRRVLLRRAVDFGGPLRLTPHRVTLGREAFRNACARGWEGIVAKHADSTYVQGRSREWLKWKCLRVEDLVVGGFTESSSARTGFGALLVGETAAPAAWSEPPSSDSNDTFEQPPHGLRYVGRVGTGFDEAVQNRLRGIMEEIETAEPPFTPDSLGRERSSRGPGRSPEGEIHWVRPELVVRVGYTERTSGGRLRHPRFLGVVREPESSRSRSEKPASQLE